MQVRIIRRAARKEVKASRRASLSMKLPRLKHKFGAKRTDRDGIKFDSKKEAARYDDLKHLQNSGEVVMFLRQTPFHFPGMKYVCDFTVFWADGTVTFEDVKGYDTPQSKQKRRQVEATYPIEIKLI